MASPWTSSRVKWISDFDKNVLSSNFEKRGWVKGSSEGVSLVTANILFMFLSNQLFLQCTGDLMLSFILAQMEIGIFIGKVVSCGPWLFSDCSTF